MLYISLFGISLKLSLHTCQTWSVLRCGCSNTSAKDVIKTRTNTISSLYRVSFIVFSQIAHPSGHNHITSITLELPDQLLSSFVNWLQCREGKFFWPESSQKQLQEVAHTTWGVPDEWYSGVSLKKISQTVVCSMLSIYIEDVKLNIPSMQLIT